MKASLIVPVAALGVLAFAILGSLISVSTMHWSVSLPESNIGAYIGLFDTCTYQIKIGRFIISDKETCYSLTKTSVYDVATGLGANNADAEALYLALDATRGLVVLALILALLALVTGAVLAGIHSCTMISTSHVTQEPTLMAIPASLALLSGLLSAIALIIWTAGVNKGINRSRVFSAGLGYSCILAGLACALTFACAGMLIAAIVTGRRDIAKNKARVTRPRAGSAASADADGVAVELTVIPKPNPNPAMTMKVPAKTQAYAPSRAMSVHTTTSVRGGLLGSSSTASSASNPGSGSMEAPHSKTNAV